MARQINVAAIANALAGKVLGVGRFIVSTNKFGGDVCRCALGELAHVAGIADSTLRRIDEYSAAAVGVGTLPYTPKKFDEICQAVDVALARTFALAPDDKDCILSANDSTNERERVDVVVAVCAMRNKVLEFREREPGKTMTKLTCSWCSHANEMGKKWCAECGHRCDLARALCDCGRKLTNCGPRNANDDWRDAVQQRLRDGTIATGASRP